MGLGTSHDCWRGSCGAFGRWRRQLARCAGYAIWRVEYEDGILADTVMIDWGHIHEINLMGEWLDTPADPLLVLIAHSDCEGKIYAAQCGALADRLEKLLPMLPMDDDPGHIGNWHEKTQTFIKGLRAAASSSEDVEFY